MVMVGMLGLGKLELLMISRFGSGVDVFVIGMLF